MASKWGCLGVVQRKRSRKDRESCVPGAPASPVGPTSPGTGRVWSPATPLCTSLPPQWVRASQQSMVVQGCLWGTCGDALSPGPFCPTSMKCSLAMWIPLSQGPVTSQSFTSPFYLATCLNCFIFSIGLCGSVGTSTRSCQ